MDIARDFVEAIKAGDRAKVEELLNDDSSLVMTRTEEGISPVLLAVYYQEPQLAELLLARLSEQGMPPDVFEAAATGKVEWVKHYVDGDPDLGNAYAPDGFQPLGLAAFFGHAPVVQFLLNRGISPNSASHNPQAVMPLHSAAATRQVSIARMLLENGADANARQTRGFTPLHAAAQNGDADMVRLLLKHNADRSAQAESGETPLDLAKAQGHEAVVALLQGE